MAALMGFLAFIGTIAVLMWRLSLAIRAARDIGNAAKEVANLPRKMNFRSKTGKTGVQLITDPREAAVLLMLSVARAGSEVSKQQKDAIINQITGRFALPMSEAEAMLAHIAWLSKDLPEPQSAVGRMSKIVQASVSVKELIELEEMLMQIAHVEGEPGHKQKQILNQFALKVGI